MNCMKCGRETVGNQVFCPGCLADMKLHPVKPGAVVQLPTQKAPTQIKKQPRRRSPMTGEARIRELTRRNRLLTLLLIVVLVFAAFFASISTKVIRDLVSQQLVGKNYSTITPSSTPPTGENE